MEIAIAPSVKTELLFAIAIGTLEMNVLECPLRRIVGTSGLLYADAINGT